jgi:murein L,D-transpeptidase YafK
MRPIVLLASLLSMLLVLFACSRERAPVSVEHADRILILKSARTLNLMSGGRILRTYKVALGRSPIGPKTRTGDHKTPEGEYVIDAKKANSRFYRALHISYPSADDSKRAHAGGYDPGGDVEIHGIENALGWIGGLHRSIDWTDGCVAVTDTEMDQIWNAVALGTPVEIKP